MLTAICGLSISTVGSLVLLKCVLSMNQHDLRPFAVNKKKEKFDCSIYIYIYIYIKANRNTNKE